MEENNYKELSRSLLSKDAHFSINKKIMKLYGIEVALFLASLIWKEEYFENQNMLKELKGLSKKSKKISGKWFFNTQEDLKNDTGLTPYLQAQCSKILEQQGILNIEKKGLPARNYFQINHFELFQILSIPSNKSSKPLNSSPQKFSSLENKKIDNINSLKENSLKENSLKGNIICSKEQITTSNEVVQSNFLNSTVGQKGIKQDELDKPKKDYSIDIEDYSSDVQNIYEFWNSLGKPLSKHRNGSKTNYNAIKALNKVVKKFPANEIMDAMERYHNMLINGQEYKLNIRAPGNLVGLNEFFRFDDYTISRIDKNNPAYGIQSWFEECSKNDLYLQRTYGKHKVEDEYPETTKKIKQYWKEYTNTPIPSSPNSEDCFRLASNKFHRFVKKHARNQLLQDELSGKKFADNSEYIYKALEKTINEDWDKIKVHWLCSDNMFDERLRDYFISQGMMWEEMSDYGPSWLPAGPPNNTRNQSNHQKEQRELYSGYEEYEDEYSDIRRELNQL